MTDLAKGLAPRIAAFKALERIRAGAHSETALSEICSQFELPARDTSLAWAVTMAILRNRNLLDAAIDAHLERKKLDSATRDILRIGAAQTFFFDRIPKHAIVSTSVQLARHLKKEPVTGLVNAVLRKLQNLTIDDISLPENRVKRTAVRYSHPEWLIQRWVNRYGRGFAGALAAANNIEPPLTLRTNIKKIPPRKLLGFFSGQGIDAEQIRHFPEYIKVEAPGHPSKLPGFKDGFFSVQDPAFGFPVELLDPLPGEKILEIGCAPGGKLTHLAERFGGEIVLDGVDISKDRLELVEENLDRLGLSKYVTLHNADARNFGEPETYDAVLIDAPCTSFGVIRRHPEIRYERSPGDIERMSELQRELIIAGLRVLKPGGRLVYCACSTEPEEGEKHIDILPPGSKVIIPKNHTLAAYISDNILRTWPHLHNLDGSVAFLVETPR